MKTEEKVKEEKEYQRVVEGSERYIEILMEANELVARLETRLKVIARIGQQARTKVLSERETETTRTFNPSVRMQPDGYNNTELITRLISSSLIEHLRVNLPKLQLPVFDGNLQQWQEFWDIYKATIHEQQFLSSVI